MADGRLERHFIVKLTKLEASTAGDVDSFAPDCDNTPHMSYGRKEGRKCITQLGTEGTAEV